MLFDISGLSVNTNLYQPNPNVKNEDIFNEATMKLEQAAAMAKALTYADIREMHGLPQQAYFQLLEDMILDSRKLISCLFDVINKKN